MNSKQRDEIEVLDFFGLTRVDYSKATSVANLFSGLAITESGDGVSPEEAYFLITSQGVKSVEVSDAGRLMFLLDAKRWAMRTCDSYEEDILLGVCPYIELLDDIPESVAKYLAKKLFQGMDRELILRVWENLNLFTN